MKNLYVFILLAFMSSGLKAQPIITSNVLPVLGDSILMSFDSTLVPVGVSGANVAWDFSTSLHQDFFFKRIYLLPANTPYSSIFPNAVLCRTDGIGSAYSYWDNTNSSKSICYGFVEPNYYTQHYNNLPVRYYQFPISYGNSYIDSVSAVTNPGNLIGPGKYAFTADAWGSLKLPNKTVANVLRTKSVFYIGDSSIGVNSYSLSTEYAWYQVAKKEPLLVISSVVINHVLYKKFVLFDNTASSGVVNNEAAEIFSIMPNPTKDKLTLVFEPSSINANAKLSMYDISGKIILSRPMNTFEYNTTLDIEFLAKGIYILEVFDGKQSSQQKFIKE